MIDPWVGFARAAMRGLGLEPRGLRALPSGPSGQNRVFRAGGVVLKVRVDPDDDASAEAAALSRGPRAVLPRLLAHGQTRGLYARAAGRDRAALEPGAGGILALEAAPGRPPDLTNDTDVERFAAAVHALHAHDRPRGRADLRADRARVESDLIAIADPGARVDAARLRALKRALREAALPKDRAPLTWCHGDLRAHNALVSRTRTTLIDLEHARPGDPALDLALLLAPEDTLTTWRFLDAYAAAARDVRVARRAVDLLPFARVAREVARLEHDDAVARGLRPSLRPASRARAAGVRTVCVDGTACSGKTSLARGLAVALSCAHLSSGALYRYAARVALDRGLSPERDAARLLGLLARAEVSLTDDGALLAHGRRVEQGLYGVDVEETVARWAALPDVRAFAGERVRAARGRRRVVVEGRDAKQVLLPRADLAFFVDADPKVRARRLAVRLPELSAPRARALLSSRDALDRGRALAPMTPHTDAVRVDTSRAAREETLLSALALAERQR